MATHVGISDRSISVATSVSELAGLRPTLLPSAPRTNQRTRSTGSGRTRQRRPQCRSFASSSSPSAAAAAADGSVALHGQDFSRQGCGLLCGRACLVCAAQGCVSCLGVHPRSALPPPGWRRRYSRRRVSARGSQESAAERFLDSEAGGLGGSGVGESRDSSANSSSNSSSNSGSGIADCNGSNEGTVETNGNSRSSNSSDSISVDNGSEKGGYNATGSSNGNGAMVSFGTTGSTGSEIIPPAAAAAAPASASVPVISAVTPDTLWEELLPCITYLSPTQLQVVRHALRLAFRAHDGQKRKSGEPYIIHPVEVARILGQLEMDWETVVAGLLHDTVEDTDLVTFQQIEAAYGPAVRRIVEGETKVSKLGKVKDGSKADVKADDLRQMFLAMTEEVRVIIVKLADRLHNMRTLTHMPPHKQKYIAQETLSVFAPLARLLGMYHIKTELEDLSFRYAYPDDYVDVSERMLTLCTQQQPALDEAHVMLEEAMRRDRFLDLMTSGARVETRCKEPYSIYKKVVETGARVEEIHEISQIRIVLSMRDSADQPDSSSRNIAQQVCYHVLGLVHALWRPLPGTVKDYIATPKPNGYQSLHTTVLPLGASSLFPLEVQIRTEHMDKLAEWGIAAHHTGRHPHLLLPPPQQQGQLMQQLMRLEQEQQGQWRGSEATAGMAGVEFPVGTDDSSTEEDSDGDSSGSDELVQGELRKVGGSGSAVGAGSAAAAAGAVADGAGGSLVGVESGAEVGAAVCGGLPETQSTWSNDADVARRVSWLNSIREWQEEFVGAISAREFVDTVTCDLFGSRIFVFTPKGEVKNLPKGATVIDYAYHIHTDVGNRMVAAKVNGNFVAPTYALSNGEVVEVLTYKGGAGGMRKGFKQRQQWLQYAKTRSARHKLTKYLKEQGALKAHEITAERINEFLIDLETADARPASSDSSIRDSSSSGGGRSSSSSNNGTAFLPLSSDALLPSTPPTQSQPTQPPSTLPPSPNSPTLLPVSFTPSSIPSASPLPRSSRPPSHSPSSTAAPPPAANGSAQVASKRRSKQQSAERSTREGTGKQAGIGSDVGVSEGRGMGRENGVDGGREVERGSSSEEGSRFLSNSEAAADVASARLAAGDADVSPARAEVDWSVGERTVEGGSGGVSREGIDEMVSRVLEGVEAARIDDSRVREGSEGAGRSTREGSGAAFAQKGGERRAGVSAGAGAAAAAVGGQVGVDGESGREEAAASGALSAAEGGGASVDAFAEFEEWQMQTIAMWQFLSGRRKVVQWLAVHCYDRTGMLAEVSKIVTDSGMLICTHAGRTNRSVKTGVMLFEIDGPDPDLAVISNALLSVEGVLSFALGCTLANSPRFWPWNK